MEAILRLLNGHERIILVSHVKPDGDAVGSLLGLSYGLASIGKEVTPVLLDGVPSVFTFLTSPRMPVSSVLKQPDTESVCIILDAADIKRTGDIDTTKLYAHRQRLAVIDHHPLGDLHKSSVAYYHDIDASSTAEMVYQILVKLGVRITPEIATCLYTGMYTDTAGFKHGNTRKETLEIASELLKRGAALRKIIAEISQQKSIARLKLIGIAMQRIVYKKKLEIAYSVIQNKDLIEQSATQDDLVGIVNQVSVVPDIKFFMMLREETPGLIRGSLRTPEGRRKISVRQLAKLLGGGGHAASAGFEVKGELIQPSNPLENGWQIR